jgi:hypothetical protein
LTKTAFSLQKTAGSVGVGRNAAERNPMTFAAIDEQHTEGTFEKKEKKISFSGNWEIRDLFDGIDSDLRLEIILNGRL